MARLLGTQREGYSKSGYRLVIAFGAVIAIAMFIVLLFTSMQIVCYGNYDMYRQEYEKYNVLDNLPEGVTLSEEDGLMAVTKHMMKYLIGDKDTPDLQIRIRTAEGMRDFFNERELLHMADCRVLFKKALQLRYICIMLILFLLVYGRFAIVRDKGAFLRALGKGLLIGSAVFFGLVAILAIYMVADFSKAFVQFHLIFFDNDLWLLDPRDSLLINILPEGFFFDVVKKVLLIFVPATAVFLGVSVFIDRKYKDAGLTFRD